MMPTRSRSKGGFTLFDLLIILALMLLLLGLLLPALQKVRVSESRRQCGNNLKQISLGMHNMNDTYNKLPPAFGDFPGKANGFDGTFFFYLLPFIEHDEVYRSATGGPGTHLSVWHNGTFTKVIKTYLCPDDKSGGDDHLFEDWLATSSYAVNYLAIGDKSTSIPRSFQDGTSNTIAFTERFQICNGTPNGWAYAGDTNWAPVVARSTYGLFQIAPAQAQCNPELAQGPHADGLVIGMADASIRSVKATLSAQTWYYALCPNDGNVLGSDW